MTKKETAMAKLIMDENDGQVIYSIKQTAKIINRHTNRVPEVMEEQGFLAKTSGQKKEFNVFNIAEYCCKNWVSPV